MPPVLAASTPRRPAERLCDGLLDFALLAFATWTVLYHVCLVLRLGAAWAGAAWLAALAPCAWLAFRPDPETGLGEPRAPAGASPRARALLLGGNVLAAGVAAALFAFSDTRWALVWVLWMLAAAAALALALRREEPRPAAPAAGPAAWLPAAVALGWAVGLALLVLFTVTTAADDTYYVHLSAWIGEHGEFPLRDTLFSDEVFAALWYPPAPSIEALIGTASYATGAEAAALTYLVAAPAATALMVLAAWRLLRAWGVAAAAAALSVAMLFLLLDGAEHRALGLTVLTRSWHGKVMIAAVLVPLLYVLLQDAVERPGRRRLALLAAAGTAGVGLSTTGIFLVPVVAAGCLLPVALRSPRRALAPLLAACAYPLGAGAAVLAVGGRTPLDNPYVTPGTLVNDVLASGLPAFVGVLAVLAGPVLVPRALGAGMTASTALLVGLLFTPPAMEALFELTGLGRVLWRLAWALPVAALVGALAVGLGARARAPALRLAPAALVCAALVLWGTPTWSPAKVRLADEPSWKRPPETIPVARAILAEAEPGDVVLAPTAVSQTLAVMSGSVTTVAPRGYYARALRGQPDGHPGRRLLLQRFADDGPTGNESAVGRALETVGVDVACVVPSARARQVLLDAGYEPAFSDGSVECLRAGRAR
ncbi:MAG TPA: DUF6077 domain-containing protein [Gaiellaceae bacterium]|nr:DUF6077 domain-containing protein [Gaiellaceae bacterium]